MATRFLLDGNKRATGRRTGWILLGLAVAALAAATVFATVLVKTSSAAEVIASEKADEQAGVWRDAGAGGMQQELDAGAMQQKARMWRDAGAGGPAELFEAPAAQDAGSVWRDAGAGGPRELFRPGQGATQGAVR